MKRLSEIAPGISVMIREIENNEIFLKLMEMGFIPGELHRVIFHGALHLCGYKDKLKKDQVDMRQKEDRYLQEYFK